MNVLIWGDSFCNIYVYQIIIVHFKYLTILFVDYTPVKQKITKNKVKCRLVRLVVVAVESVSCIQLFVTSWTAARQASLSFIISRSLLKLISLESVMPPKHLILCHPLLLLPSMFPSIRVFSNESTFCIRWPKYWNFSFSISPSNDYSGLISFRISWFVVLAVQGTLKTLQHHILRLEMISYIKVNIMKL